MWAVIDGYEQLLMVIYGYGVNGLCIYVVISIVMSGYQWLWVVIDGYELWVIHGYGVKGWMFMLWMVISDYEWILCVHGGYVWLSMVVSGYWWLSMVMDGY